MNFSYKLLGIILLPLLLMSGCKYEDNPPIFPVRTKLTRLVNSWQFQKVLRNGHDVIYGNIDNSVDYSMSSIGFNKLGRFSTVITEVLPDGTSEVNQYDGSWDFDETKERLLLTYDPPFPLSGENQIWNLTRLQHKKLWAYEEFPSGVILEYQFVPTVDFNPN